MCLGAGEAFTARRLRNHKEFGGAWTQNVKNVVLPGVSAASILQRGQTQQESAATTGPDEDFLQKLRLYPNYKPKINPSITPLSTFSRPTSTSYEKHQPIFSSLETFLAPRPIRPPSKRIYTFDKTLPAEQRKKIKKKVSERNKRGDDRYKEQVAINDACKKIAREKRAKTKQLARVLTAGFPTKEEKLETAENPKKPSPGAWTGPKVEYDGWQYSLEDLVKMNFDEFEWDGNNTQIHHRLPKTRIVFRSSFSGVFPTRQNGRLLSRRSDPSSKSFSPSSGLRKVEVTDVAHTPPFRLNIPLLNELRADASMQQLARYMDHLMLCYFPRLQVLYANILHQLQVDNPELEVTFERCCFAAFNVNFGSAVTLRHTDYLNLLFGQCAVFPVGDYDYKKGGHLVIWDLKLAIQFPPGTVILLPSALLEHCNTSIGDSDTRTSVTFYSASGLFRWVTNGYMSDKEFLARSNQQTRSRWQAYRDNLWSVGLDILRDTF
ncbi:hypothetical protein AAF712_015328 [Marasmius tenuissimus]|uniref:Uncharacterized protein n=1 Tax=Marasmius tenuissimus TaxID=585030 RepID=A0ABR2Z9X0_9AGAR